MTKMIKRIPFSPPKRVLMGPGPSNVSSRVLEAMARPTIGHLDPSFISFMEETKGLLRLAFETQNKLTIPVSGPGSVAMELCLVNLLEPEDSLIVCRNGAFGSRMADIAIRCGAKPILIDDDWGKAVDLAKVSKILKQHKSAKALAFVHAETSTGVKSDASGLCALAKEYGVLSIVDAVTSLGGVPVHVDKWGADVVYSGAQKCLSCPPGLSMVTFSERAADVIASRKVAVQSWFMDLSLVMGYWDEGVARSYHHTAPINALFGLHEALLMLEEEGHDRAWSRHWKMHQALKAGLDAMGLNFLVDEPSRLPQLNTICVPNGVAEDKVRKRLLEDFDLEIGAGLSGLAGKVWRIGLMGASANAANVTLCLSSLETVLHQLNTSVELGAAVPAADAALADLILTNRS